MIARIIPIKRLPAHLSYFDYAVPADYQDRIAIGQLVVIPFRKSNIFGLVLSLSKKGEEGLKDISEIYIETPIISPTGLKCIEMLSAQYRISMGTAAKLALPPLQKRKLKKVTLSPHNKTSPSKKKKPEFVSYSTSKDRASLIQKNSAENTLILVPEKQHCQEIFSALDAEQQKRAVIWNSDLSTKEQFEFWCAIQRGAKTIIIGTRGAVFLPFPELDTIIIEQEHHPQHKHWDQAPRYHAKDVAHWLAEEHGAQCLYLSFSPSCETYFNVHKKKMRAEKSIISPPRKLPTIIDMSEEMRAGRYGALSDAAKQALEESTQDVFLFLQRRGFSRSLRCTSCHFLSVCPQCSLPLSYHEADKSMHCHSCNITRPTPEACPQCKKATIAFRGVGTEFLESGVNAFLSDLGTTAHVIRVDGDKPFAEPAKNGRRIIIGTEAGFEHIRWDKTDLVIFVDIDAQLQIPEYKAAEHVWHSIQETLFNLSESAAFLVQTRSPQHVLIKSLPEPDRFYRTELNARMTLGYPPYSYLVRYFYGAPSKKQAESAAETLHQKFSTLLTTQQKKAIILHPIEMQPQYFRRKFWYTLLVKIPPEEKDTTIELLNRHTPEQWKVDPNPTALLKP